jgi:class 3 adenylate cyclase
MTPLTQARRPLFRSPLAARRWPPYELVEESIEEVAQRKLERLERLYHKGQDQVWDGRAVLQSLIEKHGKPRLPDDKRESALLVLSVLLWGELAAWAISADLAERIEDIEAKMAATSQAHDEARHFYVLRDYLRALGEPVPRLGGVGRRLLVGILESDSLVHKLIGMQLMVESNALALFKGIAEANLEPVLTDLLPYYERDEARHVGLGVMYLPTLLSSLSRVEAARVTAFQLRTVGLLITAGLPMRDHFRNLGLEPRRLAARTSKLQDDILRQMREVQRDAPSESSLGGLLSPGKGIGPAILDFVHPPDGEASAPLVNRAVLGIWRRGAMAADRWLA